jgi:hypothetical protein
MRIGGTLVLGAALAACGGSTSGGVGDAARDTGAPPADAPAAPPPKLDAPLPSPPPGPRAPRLALSVTDVDLGNVNIGTTSAPGIVVVMNTGDAASGPLAVSLTGPPEFTSTTNCTGRRLGLGETCVVTLRFAPTAMGVRSAMGKVSQTEGAPMEQPFTVHGNGRIAPDGGPDAPPADTAPRPDAAPETAPDAGVDAPRDAGAAGDVTAAG